MQHLTNGRLSNTGSHEIRRGASRSSIASADSRAIRLKWRHSATKN